VTRWAPRVTTQMGFAEFSGSRGRRKSRRVSAQDAGVAICDSDRNRWCGVGVEGRDMHDPQRRYLFPQQRRNTASSSCLLVPRRNHGNPKNPMLVPQARLSESDQRLEPPSASSLTRSQGRPPRRLGQAEPRGSGLLPNESRNAHPRSPGSFRCWLCLCGKALVSTSTVW